MKQKPGTEVVLGERKTDKFGQQVKFTFTAVGGYITESGRIFVNNRWRFYQREVNLDDADLDELVKVWTENHP